MRNGIAAGFFRKKSFGPAILTGYFKLLLFTSLAGDVTAPQNTQILSPENTVVKTFFFLHDIWKEIRHTY